MRLRWKKIHPRGGRCCVEVFSWPGRLNSSFYYTHTAAGQTAAYWNGQWPAAAVRAVWWDARARRLKWIPIYPPAVGGCENIEEKKEWREDHLSLLLLVRVCAQSSRGCQVTRPLHRSELSTNWNWKQVCPSAACVNANADARRGWHNAIRIYWLVVQFPRL